MGADSGQADSFTLARDAAGGWTISGDASPPAVPARFAEQLEAGFQRAARKER
jgi:hypothetical protein